MHTVGDDIERTKRYLALLQTFKGHIFNYCYSHSNDEADAEDLMQEIFTAVWQGIPGLRSDSSPRQQNRWLQHVMRTAFFRHLRQRLPFATVPLTPDNDRADDSNTEHELLDELLGHLTDDERHLVQQRLQGYSYAEIAEQEQLNENAVKQRFHRIINKLKQHIQS